jgi:thymidylate synthase ThyX
MKIYLEWALNLYEYLTSTGMSKDKARLVLPLGTRTKSIMSFWDDDNFKNFIRLRSDSSAHLEAQKAVEI